MRKVNLGGDERHTVARCETLSPHRTPEHAYGRRHDGMALWSGEFDPTPRHRVPNQLSNTVSSARAISAFDLVELTEPVDDAPVGSRGAVLELTDTATAMVEVTSPALDAAERIVFAPLSSLRRVV